MGAACCGPILLAAQPRSVWGSPDDILEPARARAAKIADAWAAALARAVRGKRDASAIASALERVADRRSVSGMAAELEDAILHAGMLGALDSDFEAVEDTEVRPVAFSARLLRETDAKFAIHGLDEAITVFEERQVLTPDVFELLSDWARARAFTIAGLMNERMLEDAKRELVRQVAAGADLRDFRKWVEARLESAGWTPANPSHVETVFRTNVMHAYNGGRLRHQTQPSVLEARPYWQWLSVADGRARKAHKRAHQKVLRADDPWWREAYPPAGYNCRCRVRTLRKPNGLRVVTGADMPTPLPDKGFRGGTGQLLAT